MTDERYNLLMSDVTTQLTAGEWKAGWHFCFDWDGLLIGPGMKETECCECFQERHDGPKRAGHPMHEAPTVNGKFIPPVVEVE